jgi:hypothetical protein
MKRALQIAIALAGAEPVFTGLAGILLGSSWVGDISGTADIDSQFRFLSTLLLALGLGVWSTIRDIERQGRLLRRLAAVMVLGGVARLPSFLMFDLPETTTLVSLAVEIAIMPLLCLWQARLAKWSAPEIAPEGPSSS